MKITIDIPDELLKSLKSDFSAQVVAEKFLGIEISASSKVAQLVLQAAKLMQKVGNPPAEKESPKH